MTVGAALLARQAARQPTWLRHRIFLATNLNQHKSAVAHSPKVKQFLVHGASRLRLRVETIGVGSLLRLNQCRAMTGTSTPMPINKAPSRWHHKRVVAASILLPRPVRQLLILICKHRLQILGAVGMMLQHRRVRAPVKATPIGAHHQQAERGTNQPEQLQHLTVGAALRPQLKRQRRNRLQQHRPRHSSARV